VPALSSPNFFMTPKMTEIGLFRCWAPSIFLANRSIVFTGAFFPLPDRGTLLLAALDRGCDHRYPWLDVNEALTGDDVEVPQGFVTYAGNAGIKDESLDLSIIASTIACVADGVFTKSLFAGPSVVLSRSNLQSGGPRAIVTVSKNANVATGPQGVRDAAALAELVAAVIGSEPADVLVGSTGVIGRQLPDGAPEGAPEGPEDAQVRRFWCCCPGPS